ncbi:MAG: hypothetical protein ABL966_08270 [Acidimicrobiales bacterium]
MFAELQSLEFKSRVDLWRERFETQPPMFFDTPAASFDLSTQFAVWLLGFRMFIDQTHAELAKRASQDRLENWKRATSEIYDSSPMYRLAYGLRNFTHVDMPGSLRVKKHVSEPTEFVLELRRDHLLASGDWQAITKRDLRQGPDLISALDLMEQAQSDLRALLIHELICDFPAAAQAYNRVSALIEEVDQSTTERCDPILVDERQGSGPTPFTYSYLNRGDVEAVYRAAHGECRLRAMDQEIVFDVPALTELWGESVDGR